MQNIPEYLISAGASSQKEISFWLKMSLAFHEAHSIENIDRVMIYLGLFYLQGGDAKLGVETLTETISKMRDRADYTNVFGLNMTGRYLLKNKETKKEATAMLKRSESLASKLPYWYDKLPNLYTIGFQTN